MIKISTRALEDQDTQEGVFNFPCLEFTQPSDDYKALDAGIRANHTYDWVIFHSKRAAEKFFERLMAIGGNLFNLSPRLKIAVIGPRTKDFIENEISFHVSFMPSEFNSEKFLEEFLEKYNGEPLNIFMPRNEIADDDFIDRIESAGYNKVTLAHAYNAICPEPDEARLKELKEHLEKGAELKFMSSQTVRNFYKLTNGMDLASYPGLEIKSIGPKTSATVKEIYPDLKVLEYSL